jgi:hypothetical protein
LQLSRCRFLISIRAEGSWLCGGRGRIKGAREELQLKFTDCAERILDAKRRSRIFEFIENIEEARSVDELILHLAP